MKKLSMFFILFIFLYMQNVTQASSLTYNQMIEENNHQQLLLQKLDVLYTSLETLAKIQQFKDVNKENQQDNDTLLYSVSNIRNDLESISAINYSLPNTTEERILIYKKINESMDSLILREIDLCDLTIDFINNPNIDNQYKCTNLVSDIRTLVYEIHDWVNQL